MTDCLDGDFLAARIARTKATIVLYEDAIDAILVKGVKTYRLNTGQTDQLVTRLDIANLEVALDGYLNRLATLCQRQTGIGTTINRPVW